MNSVQSRHWPDAQANGDPSGGQATESPSARPDSNSASEVSGIKGMLITIAIGAIRWNRNATRGQPTSQITADPTTPALNPTRPIRQAIFHQGSNFRSSASSGVKLGASHSRTAGTDQKIAATPKNDN
jgi:hypothetical protein